MDDFILERRLYKFIAFINDNKRKEHKIFKLISQTKKEYCVSEGTFSILINKNTGHIFSRSKPSEKYENLKNWGFYDGDILLSDSFIKRLFHSDNLYTWFDSSIVNYEIDDYAKEQQENRKKYFSRARI